MIYHWMQIALGLSLTSSPASTSWRYPQDSLFTNCDSISVAKFQRTSVLDGARKVLISAPDSHARPMWGFAPPAYPDSLRSSGVEGSVSAVFIVDTTYRADTLTFMVLSSSHDRFSTAVKRAVGRQRFIPAQHGGDRVKELVCQTFSFTLNRG
jgi:hypothetical protein